MNIFRTTNPPPQYIYGEQYINGEQFINVEQ